MCSKTVFGKKKKKITYTPASEQRTMSTDRACFMAGSLYSLIYSTPYQYRNSPCLPNSNSKYGVFPEPHFFFFYLLFNIIVNKTRREGKKKKKPTRAEMSVYKNSFKVILFLFYFVIKCVRPGHRYQMGQVFNLQKLHKFHFVTGFQIFRIFGLRYIGKHGSFCHRRKNNG